MSETGHPELQLTLSRLQRSYNLLNDAASIARIGCFEWEIEADRSTWSREMYEILGLDREELGDDIKAELIFEMIHPDDLDHVRENHIRGLAENRSIPSEFRVIRPDKSVVTLYASGQLEMDASGKPVRLLGTLQDITERKQAEESQRRSDELYRLVTDAIPALIAYVDAQQCYRFANRTFEEWTGQERSRIYGRHIRDVLGEAAYDEIEKHVDRVLGGDEVTFEAELPYGPGGARHVMTTYVPHVGDDEVIHGFFALVQDVTDRKRVEEERRVIDARLQETQKLESLGLLAGGIAHDFNNMLTGIMGNSGLVRMELPAESPLMQNLHDIETTARSLSDFCKQMLAYSGKGRFLLQTLNLNGIIQDMIQMLQFSKSKKAVLECDLAEDLPGIDGDASQIRQVIMNFVINASEAIGDKSGSVRLRTGTMHADRAFLNESLLGPDLVQGEYVFLEVSDDGCGISDEDRSRIFDPFYTTKFGGRGLGWLPFWVSCVVTREPCMFIPKWAKALH